MKIVSVEIQSQRSRWITLGRLAELTVEGSRRKESLSYRVLSVPAVITDDDFEEVFGTTELMNSDLASLTRRLLSLGVVSR